MHLRYTLALLLSLVPALPAASIPDFNGSFEAGNSGWEAVRGAASADATAAHDGKMSLRVEAGSSDDACIRSTTLSLTPGKRYELAAWVRTDGLAVRDLDRTPVALGAAVTMASMPFNLHSEAVGGTRGWTRVRLRFTATRSRDEVLLTAGQGGALRGRAWFDGVSVEEIEDSRGWPSRASVATLGPAYRYPVGGWIYLHIEGQPYERGYQHGQLMAKEIEQYVDRCALELDHKSKETAWEMGRTAADALFLRGFDREILEEMKGIADGAAAAGAKFGKRKIDLKDIVASNTITELGELRAAMPMTPTGLEGLKFVTPGYALPDRTPATMRCSAFAATGKATRDGRMVIGHITMWSLLLAEQTNIVLDVKPAAGHRVLIQAFPGGIESGTDWYQNDAGVVLTETTIRQSPFNVQGTPIAFRARKAIQYGDNIDRVVEHLSRNNNGLYTNEWLIGDAKNDEIAMFEMGTNRTKLWRSSRNEWFGGTEGFYWGCNNAKDLDVRLEYAPDPKGAPAHLPFVPASRDIKWQEMYDRFKGRIDEQFGFLAFRTAPLVSSSSMDAKIATSGMASRMTMWAVFGKPNEREWVPGNESRQRYPVTTGLYSGGYRLIEAEPPAAFRAMLAEVEKERLSKPKPPADNKEAKKTAFKDRRWEGWILPASDADLWLSAGSADYYYALGEDDLALQMSAARARYSAAAQAGDKPLLSLSTDLRSEGWEAIASGKGALALDALRGEMGDDKFLAFMKDFFAVHTTQRVSTAEFTQAAEKAAGKPLAKFFDTWLREPGLAGAPAPPMYSVPEIGERLNSTILVYGTMMEAGTNRHAAEILQHRYLDWFESEIPVRKDFEATAEELRTHNVIFIGRPETNSALAAWAERLGLRYEGAAFENAGKQYGSEYEGLALAAPNPEDPAKMVLVLAGNTPLETVRVAGARPETFRWAVYRAGKKAESGF